MKKVIASWKMPDLFGRSTSSRKKKKRVKTPISSVKRSFFFFDLTRDMYNDA
jgi:hypothetical protein